MRVYTNKFANRCHVRPHGPSTWVGKVVLLPIIYPAATSVSAAPDDVVNPAQPASNSNAAILRLAFR